MKIHLLILVFFSVYFIGSAQHEFKQYSKGLIYSKRTMSKLDKIVDSLNLEFAQCDFNRDYRSLYQTVAHRIELDSGDVKQCKLDMEKGMPFDSVLIKYPNLKVKRNVLVIKFVHTIYKRDVLTYQEIVLNSSNSMVIEHEHVEDTYHRKDAKTWVFDYYLSEKGEFEYIAAFYFPEEFKTFSIPERYVKQIAYSDCLIDTNTTKLIRGRYEDRVRLPLAWKFRSKARKELLLNELRSTRVRGMCSQDKSPRIHSKNIALMSAELVQWSVFIKAHLDLVNDRFDRISDGSYAYGKRGTYLKELEELNIRVPDLFMGILFEIENPSKNHYIGSCSRLGRAISESKNKSIYEQYLLSMIEDKDLDEYNRLRAYFMFESYIAYLNEKEQFEKKALLIKALQSLPEYLKKQIKL